MVALAALREWRPIERLREPVRLDPITSLPNRRQFQADSATWGGPRSTLVLVTLADAQAFNDILRVLGPARSDAFIRAGAARLIEILGPGSKIYHINILSFAFRLPGHAEPDPPAMIARVIDGFRQPILCDDVPIDTRIGIGMKALGRGSPGEDLRATLSAAQDSRVSPTGWAWFDRKSDEAHRRAFRLLSDLKHALGAESQLELHYQPKVTLETGACLSAEALLRWTHPELGPVSPGEFVELAEKTALVTPMTRWVIDAATRQAAIWARDGLELSLAVNVSPKNLEEPDFIEYLLFCCAARRIDRARIELEITEGVSAASGGLILDRLATLRRLGFSIAIDDFGSGYSNMSYLTRLSAHTLKIDKSLVRGVEADSLGGRLVSNIVQMGRDLGYRMVAEGIETEAERALLAAWGCDLGQGWHFGRPMPAPAFGDWHSGLARAAR
ncbi:bifunctional diguanylate cyclase/phosphodiesterase [Amaricoccus sp.]|uniref:putative bifunctional diguanylate cyclase/phosphodiesterase n=1 Tax=Amaricoccus sp. TaxID=1872485 RepID=UPI0026385BFD|nr:bifunctional diguanylate cyclase/phosphodiesterase [Amaricoccus sp.]HRO12213.1 bifunctional diguanylate cyclase/phosphodiesterase [Amaricoccus sp.]